MKFSVGAPSIRDRARRTPAVFQPASVSPPIHTRIRTATSIHIVTMGAARGGEPSVAAHAERTELSRSLRAAQMEAA